MRAALQAGESSATGIILVYNQSISSRKTAAASKVFEITWEGSVKRDRWDIDI